MTKNFVRAFFEQYSEVVVKAGLGLEQSKMDVFAIDVYPVTKK